MTCDARAEQGGGGSVASSGGRQKKNKCAHCVAVFVESSTRGEFEAHATPLRCCGGSFFVCRGQRQVALGEDVAAAAC